MGRSLWSSPDKVLEESDEEESLGSEEGERPVGGLDLSMVGLDVTGGEEQAGGGAGSEGFNRVVGEMVTTGYAEGHPTDNLLMEIKGFKFAQNKVCTALHYIMRPWCRYGTLMVCARLMYRNSRTVFAGQFLLCLPSCSASSPAPAARLRR
jgi:hypothetical protein